MARTRTVTSYEPVIRSGKPAVASMAAPANVFVPRPTERKEAAPVAFSARWQALKAGHKFSYAGLFAFTLLLYARPSEFYPSPVTASLALVVGLLTLAIFFPSQLALEGNLSAPVREVHLVLIFGLLAVVNIPLAMSPVDAWQTFSSTFVRCILIFLVIVNSVRTQKRLKGLLFLAVAAAVWLSVGAINDYRSGLLTVEGYRVAGRGIGIFGNTNDMALHLVTMFPIVVALLFGSRNKAVKIGLGLCAALLLAAIIVSYSRGAFLGLVVILIFLTLKLGGQNRAGIIIGILAVGLAFLVFAPGNYGTRLLSIFIPSLDPNQSAGTRRAELFRSLYVALRHPVFGIGMGNYAGQMSLRGIVTHNTYTQVAAEMGLIALACYTAFIVSPLRKLGQMVRETHDASRHSDFFYLAVGLEASLIGYVVTSFFLSVPYTWYVYYLVGFAVCWRRIYEFETGRPVVVETRKQRKAKTALMAEEASFR